MEREYIKVRCVECGDEKEYHEKNERRCPVCYNHKWRVRWLHKDLNILLEAQNILYKLKGYNSLTIQSIIDEHQRELFKTFFRKKTK